MIQIPVTTAIELVRKNLDELDPNGSVMYADEYADNLSLSDIVRRNIPEAINRVHLEAPVTMLEGEEFRGAYDSISISDGVLSFSFTADFLRLVSFQAADSGIVVTQEIPESSPEGRKQLNKYIRGRYDRPRLVRLQGAHASPAFNYYTLKDHTFDSTPVKAIRRFTFVRELFFDETADSYAVSKDLRQNALDELTGLVLAIYGYNEKANYFFEKAKPV